MTQNHYELLGVEPTATSSDIRRAFRRKAKQVHPDVNFRNGDEFSGHNSLHSVRIRELLHAYRTLINPDARHAYDASHRIGKEAPVAEFDFRKFLKERRSDGRSQARLVFYDLLHDHDEEATSLYEQYFAPLEPFESSKGMSNYLGRDDYMDCLFLLSESYERQDKLQKAFELLVKIVKEEKERPYFLDFFEEVRAGLRRLVNTISLEDGKLAITLALRMVALDISRNDTRYFTRLAGVIQRREARNRENSRNRSQSRGNQSGGSLNGDRIIDGARRRLMGKLRATA